MYFFLTNSLDVLACDLCDLKRNCRPSGLVPKIKKFHSYHRMKLRSKCKEIWLHRRKKDGQDVRCSCISTSYKEGEICRMIPECALKNNLYNKLPLKCEFACCNFKFKLLMHEYALFSCLRLLFYVCQDWENSNIHGTSHPITSHSSVCSLLWLVGQKVFLAPDIQ